MKEHHIRIVNVLLAFTVIIAVAWLAYEIIPEYSQIKKRIYKIVEVLPDGSTITSRTGHFVFSCGRYGKPSPGVFTGLAIWGVVTALGAFLVFLRIKLGLFLLRFSFLSTALLTSAYIFTIAIGGYFDNLRGQLFNIDWTLTPNLIALIISIVGLLYLHHPKVCRHFKLVNRSTFASYVIIIAAIGCCSVASYANRAMGSENGSVWHPNIVLQ
jgi:hypothetical protein